MSESDAGGRGHSRVVVIGAGVIGQVYAGRLAEAGNDVWLLARGETLTRLRDRGVCLHGVGLRSGGRTVRPSVAVVETVSEIPAVDVAYLAVRADQVDAALPVLTAVRSPVVVTLVNLADRARTVAARIGTDRVVLGFAGVGGAPTPDGVTYHEVHRQPTTIGVAGGRERRVIESLRDAGMTVAVEPDMPGWLATHAVFIAGVGAAILQAGGSESLGADRGGTARMVTSIRDGFTALTRRHITVTPRPLRIIFTRVPALLAVPYWQRQMRGDLGRLALEPHITATRDTEFPGIAAAARTLTDHAPRLDNALTAAGFPAEPRHQ